MDYYSYLKEYKKRNLNNNIRQSVIGAIIVQFYVDIFFSIFFTKNNIIKNDIKVSEMPIYIGALSSGIILGLISQFMDRIATIAIGTSFFAIGNNIANYYYGSENYNINSQELIFDIMASIILVYIFDPKSHIDYYNHYNERHHILLPNIKADRNTFDLLIIIIVLNSYSGIKNKLKNTTAPTTTSGSSNSD